MRLLDRLKSNRPTTPDLPHQAPDLELTLPDAIAGRSMARWSAAGNGFWKILGADPVRTGWAEALGTLGVSAVEVSMAVAGRADTRLDPPYIIWVLRFGKLNGPALMADAPSSLAMAVMQVDPNQGENWVEKSLAGKPVLVGHSGMVRQDDHRRGTPVVYVAKSAIYSVIAEDDAWIEEVIRSLPED